MTPQDAPQRGPAADIEPIVAVFDSKTMALRTVAELRPLELDDPWLAVVRGETDDGETTVADATGEEILLHRALLERGSSEAQARRFDGVVPPGTAVISLQPGQKSAEAIRVIEVTGGHIEYL
jgi:hypothetical protein